MLKHRVDGLNEYKSTSVLDFSLQQPALCSVKHVDMYVTADRHMYTLCFIIHAPLTQKSVSPFSSIIFSSLGWQIKHMYHTKKMSAGFFYLVTYRGTAAHQRDATKNAFCVPDCYIFSFFLTTLKYNKITRKHLKLEIFQHIKSKFGLFAQSFKLFFSHMQRQKYFFPFFLSFSCFNPGED